MIKVREALEEDQEILQAFVQKSNAGFSEECQYILVENDSRDIIGTAGIMRYGEEGLLRSFVLSDQFPPNRLPAFLERLLILAGEQGCKRVYLVTDKSSSLPFFEAFGFRSSGRKDIIQNNKLSTVIDGLFQKDEAIIMWKNL
ncbi:MAG: GNAT family N-acetyltransferase [Bacillus sp. (in: firmicutes)]